MDIAAYEVQLFNYIESHSYDENVAHLKRQSPSIMHMVQTGAVAEHIWSSFLQSHKTFTNDDLKEMTKVLCYVFGHIGIDCEASLCRGEFNTLLDSVINFHDYMRSDGGTCDYCVLHNRFCYRLAKAMRAVGFRHAYEINMIDLLHEYVISYGDPTSHDNRRSFDFGEYPYAEMKAARAAIKEELAMFLFHPDRISSWMSKHPNEEIEDYLP